MGKTQALRDGLDAVLAVTLGASCAACGEVLEHPTGGPVCVVCWRLVAASPPLPFFVSARIDRAQAISAYDGPLRSIIHALKYEGRRSLARPLGRLMRERGADMIAGAACAIPVPLHPSRRRHRGFNQAADLARQMQMPVVAALRRVRATPAQTGLPAARRHRNLRDAFAATRAARALAGATVLVIDDVSTTGATLDACAWTLKLAGIAEVRALTAGRVVDRLTADD